MTTPVPGPPRREGPPPLDAEALLPQEADLDARPVREHVAIFENLHATLAEHLDDTA